MLSRDPIVSRCRLLGVSAFWNKTDGIVFDIKRDDDDDFDDDDDETSVKNIWSINDKTLNILQQDKLK